MTPGTSGGPAPGAQRGGGRSIFLPGDDGQLVRTSLDGVALWARHPVHERLVPIRSWRDVRQLEHLGRQVAGGWDQRVAVIEAGTVVDDDQLVGLLAPGAPPAADPAVPAATGGIRVVVLDEDAARGRQRIVVGSAADGVLESLTVNDQPVVDRLLPGTRERLAELLWLEEASLSRGQHELRRRGVRNVAQRLFGTNTRRDVVAGLGHALLRRGATGGFGNRFGVVVLATLASPWLSADRIVDVLGWPVAPRLGVDPAVALGVEQMLAPLDEFRRHKLLEALTIFHTSWGDDTRSWDMQYGMPAADHGALADPALVEAYGDELLARLLVYNPGIADHVDVDSALRPEVPFTASSQVALAGVLTSACLDAGLPLPLIRDGWSEYLSDLVVTVTPSPLRWTWAPEVATLDGLTVPGTADMHLVLPASGATLDGWGDAMGNCIASYIGRLNRGRCIVLGVVGSGEVLANVSVERPRPPEPWDVLDDLDGPEDEPDDEPRAQPPEAWVVTEVSGRFNRKLPGEVESAVRAAIDAVLPTLPLATPLIGQRLEPGGILEGFGSAVRPVAVGWASRRAGTDLEEQVRRRRRGVGAVRRGRPRGGTVRPLEPARLPPDAWGDPQARAVLRCATGDRREFVTDDVVAALLPGVRPASARRIVSLMAVRDDPPQLADVVTIAAEFDPEHAWLRGGSVEGLRRLLADAVAGDPSAFDRWDDLRALDVRPDVSAAVRDLLEAWASGAVHRAVAAEAWNRSAALRVHRGPDVVAVYLEPTGDFLTGALPVDQAEWQSRQEIRAVIGYPPREPTGPVITGDVPARESAPRPGSPP